MGNKQALETHTYLHIHMYVYANTNMYTHVFTHTYAHIPIHTHTCMFKFRCTCMHAYTLPNNTHTNTHTHAHMEKKEEERSSTSKAPIENQRTCHATGRHIACTVNEEVRGGGGQKRGERLSSKESRSREITHLSWKSSCVCITRCVTYWLKNEA